MRQSELAARMGRPVQAINEIVNRKKTITAETALELERALGITAPFWTNLGTLYELVRARDAKEVSLERQIPWLKRFPAAKMAACGWIEKRTKPIEKVDELLRFFGIQEFEALEKLGAAAAYRRTPAAKVDPWPLEAWLRRGDALGAAVHAEPFDVQLFRDALSEIRPLVVADMPNLLRLREICADAGVAVVVVPNLPKAGVNGATRWIRRDRALVQLSLRYKWLDIFWFTFFHEASHVLGGYSRNVVIHADGAHAKSEIERQADQFAANILIPPEDWGAFTDAGDFSRRAVLGLSTNAGTHPAIVVGRLQHERRIPSNRLNDLRPRFDGTALAGVDQ